MAWHTVGEHDLLLCPRCGHGWLARRLSGGQLDALYDSAYFHGAEGGYPDYVSQSSAARTTAARHLDALERFLPERGRLLDVGCAAGFLLDEARRRGWSVTGVERSREMAAVARRALDLDIVETSCCPARRFQEPFDAVTVVQTLEHMDAPVTCCLRFYARQLRPGGHMLIETWDRSSLTARVSGARWQQLSPPSVQHWFSLDSLSRALTAAGLEVVAVARPGKYVGLDHVLSLVEEKYAPRFGRIARRLARRAGVEDRSIRYPLDDLIRVIARR